MYELCELYIFQEWLIILYFYNVDFFLIFILVIKFLILIVIYVLLQVEVITNLFMFNFIRNSSLTFIKNF